MWRTALLLSVAVLNAGAVHGQAPLTPQSVGAMEGVPRGLQPGRPLSSLRDLDAAGSPASQPFATPPVAPEVPAGPAPLAKKEALLTFDPRRAELRLVDDRWQLLAGTIKLKDFGSSESAGRDALHLIQDLRLNQYGAVGKPVPVMEYWLSDGQAPQGIVTRHSTLSFDPGSLHLEQVQGHWYLRDARQMLFNFGAHADDAQTALDIVRRHDFNQVAFVGFPMPAMILFLANPDRHAGKPPPAATVGPESPLQQFARLQTLQLATATSSLTEPGVAGERLPFDWRMVELRRDHNDWKLVVGSYCLANFGYHEWEAREALRVVQHYRFTEHCRLGQAVPGFSYFLVNGQAPCGVPFGLRVTAFRPEMLTVRQSAGAWGIYEGNRPILQFGDRAEEARQALQVIQRHQFDHICQVGDFQPPALSFLVRER